MSSSGLALPDSLRALQNALHKCKQRTAIITRLRYRICVGYTVSACHRTNIMIETLVSTLVMPSMNAFQAHRQARNVCKAEVRTPSVALQSKMMATKMSCSVTMRPDGLIWAGSVGEAMRQCIEPLRSIKGDEPRKKYRRRCSKGIVTILPRWTRMVHAIETSGRKIDC